MITQIDISNFRSIKQQSIPLKKLNILYGPNGSGKSSVMYAPYVMRNFFVNPNQRLNSLFNLGFINLGGFENVVRKDLKSSAIRIAVTSNYFSGYEFNKAYPKLILNLTNKTGGVISYWNGELKEDIFFELPYSATEKKVIAFQEADLLWNGLSFERINSKNPISNIVLSNLNTVYEEIKTLEIISVKRGFFSPIFSIEMESNDESRFAMQVRDEGIEYETKIDKYFQKIFDKHFRFVAIPGQSSFYLRTLNNNRLETDIVNEGFGVNQTLYMLIKLLRRNTSLAFIEEPEIHLHPSAQKKLVDVFTEIVEKENKQIFLSTHSENIVSSVLGKIAEGELSKDDVQFYLAVVENDETKIIPQEVNDKGQIEGGLMSFMETELGNLKKLLGI
jgi:predicted ATPase